MRKVASTFGFLFLCCMYGFCQKPDIEKIKTTYVQLPAQPLPDSIKTYSVQVVNLSNMPLKLNDAEINKYLQLEGFRYDAKNPDVIITVFISGVIVESGTKSKGMANGVQVQFVYTATARMEGRVCFTTPDNRFEYYSVTQLERPEDLTTTVESLTTYANENDAKQAQANDKAINDKVLAAYEDNAFKNIGAYLNKQHGYSIKSEYLPVWGIKSKGTDYLDFDQAMTSYQAGIALTNQPGKKDEMTTKFKEAGAVWEKAVAEYNPSDKNARISSRNILEIYANLVLANTWTGNFDEAKRYFALAEKEKGLLLWKPIIQEFMLTAERGTKQDALRKSNGITIEKKKSPLYKSSEFVADSKYRIKYIESYEEHNPKLLRSRKVFEYDEKGLLLKVYEQLYDISSKTFKGAANIQTMVYNQEESTITVPDAARKKPSEVFTISQGKVVKQKGVQETYNAYNEIFFDYTYYPDGALKQVVRSGKNPKSGKVTYNFIRENGKPKTIQVQNWWLELKDSVFNNLKFEFKGENGNVTVTSFVNTDGKNNLARAAATYAYTLDSKGLITSIKSQGQQLTYAYDVNNNLIEAIERSDTTPIHHTYVWEEGPGNALFYLFKPDNHQTYRGLYPTLY